MLGINAIPSGTDEDINGLTENFLNAEFSYLVLHCLTESKENSHSCMAAAKFLYVLIARVFYFQLIIISCC